MRSEQELRPEASQRSTVGRTNDSTNCVLGLPRLRANPHGTGRKRTLGSMSASLVQPLAAVALAVHGPRVGFVASEVCLEAPRSSNSRARRTDDDRRPPMSDEHTQAEWRAGLGQRDLRACRQGQRRTSEGHRPTSAALAPPKRDRTRAGVPDGGVPDPDWRVRGQRLRAVGDVLVRNPAVAVGGSPGGATDALDPRGRRRRVLEGQQRVARIARRDRRAFPRAVDYAVRPGNIYQLRGTLYGQSVSYDAPQPRERQLVREQDQD